MNQSFINYILILAYVLVFVAPFGSVLPMLCLITFIESHVYKNSSLNIALFLCFILNDIHTTQLISIPSIIYLVYQNTLQKYIEYDIIIFIKLVSHIIVALFGVVTNDDNNLYAYLSVGCFVIVYKYGVNLGDVLYGYLMTPTNIVSTVMDPIITPNTISHIINTILNIIETNFNVNIRDNILIHTLNRILSNPTPYIKSIIYILGNLIMYNITGSLYCPLYVMVMVYFAKGLTNSGALLINMMLTYVLETDMYMILDPLMLLLYMSVILDNLYNINQRVQKIPIIMLYYLFMLMYGIVYIFETTNGYLFKYAFLIHNIIEFTTNSSKVNDMTLLISLAMLQFHTGFYS